ncbi:ER lumen protein retaining receptor [Aspergillus udagawae]|nr:ER lumen protein retaining receptor [Aspergillus udagawae]
MDWERSRRFEDHRGRESYRPPAPRGYSRHTSPTRTRSPRLVADTWVPSSSRHYGRLRSRSPLPFRRHSRSPPYRHRDSDPGLFANSAPRRFSPRRDARLRSPQIGWRPRSPYDDRPRDSSRGRSTPRRRDQSPPRQDFTYSKRERYPPTVDRYKKSASPLRRGPVRASDITPLMTSHRRRSSSQEFRDRRPDNNTNQARPSPSTRAASTIHNSTSSSRSDSRRSSPLNDTTRATVRKSRSGSPVTRDFPQRRVSVSSDHSSSRQAETISSNELKSQEDATHMPPTSVQIVALSNDRGVSVPTLGRPENNSESADAISSATPQSGPTAVCTSYGQAATPNISAGPKPSFKNRGSMVSLLSAPTRPRGNLNPKDFARSTRRGHVSISQATPPTGPRHGHIPTGPSVDSDRQHIYRQNSLSGTSYPRQRPTNYLAGIDTIVPGGRLLAYDLDTTVEKRLAQLEMDKERLFEQIADSQRLKHLVIRDWERLDRESSICALKNLFWTFTDSLYNTTFKVLFICSSAYIIYLMLNDYKPTRDPNLDTFKVQYLLGISAILAVLFPHDYSISEILWTFSIWLESVAILPQLFMLQRTGEADTITTHYLFALGLYRALYIPNWIYRYFAENRFQPIPVVAGIVQTLLYSDFFYIYYTK